MSGLNFSNFWNRACYGFLGLGVTIVSSLKTVLSAVIVTCVKFFLSAGFASAGGAVSLNLTTAITPQANAAVTIVGTNVTIDSDKLASASDNAIVFDASAMTDALHIVRGVDLSTTAPKGGSAAEVTVTSTDQSAIKTFSIPVDQVASGGASVTFTVLARFYASPDGEPVSTCGEALDQKVNFSLNFDCVQTTLTVTVTAPTTGSSALINNFLRNRTRNIVSNEPDLLPQLTQAGGNINPVSYNMADTTTGFRASFEANTNYQPASLFGYGYNTSNEPTILNQNNVWIQGALARSEQNGQTQDFGIVHLGAGHKINPDLVIGGIIQVDRASEKDTSANSSISGTGWMIGPYMVARLRDNLAFDGRLAFGQSTNSVSPTGTYTDTFKTNRAMIHARITGDFMQGDVKIAPAMAFIYMQEKQLSYVDSLSVTISEQTINMGQLSTGASVSKNIVMENGMMLTPSIGLKGIWNFADTGFLNVATGAASTANNNRLSARLDAGLDVSVDEGVTLQFKGFFDGIGASNYKAYGGASMLMVRF
jgi:outer membrane autotransporter protein